MGEALVDLVVAADGLARTLAGGGPFNTACALGRLGVSTRFVGRLSSDRFGDVLRERLRADGVDHCGGPPCDEPTTLAAVTLDSGGTASYRFYSEGTSAFGLSPDDIWSGLDDVAAVHVGSLALVFDPSGQAITRAVTELPESVAIVVDPNVRPAAISDGAAFRERFALVLASADLVKVSDDDLAWLSPGRDPEHAATDLLDAGPGAVLLTKGARGVVVLTPGSRAVVPAVPVTVVDTVGAGDSFTAGVLTWWTEHGGDRAALVDPECLRAGCELGVEVAAITCGRAGADPPRRAELAP